MFVEKLLKGAVIFVAGMLLLFFTLGSSASAAEAYTLSRQISGLNAPLDVAIGPDGTAYIADQSNFRVVQYDEYGQLKNQCSFQLSGYLPIALAVEPDGEVYYVTRFSQEGIGDIIKFVSPDTCDSSEVGTPAAGIYYGGAAVAPDGSVFVSDMSDNQILKFGPDGSLIKTWGTIGNGYPDPDLCTSSGGTAYCSINFLYPKGLAILPYGGSDFLLVADSGNDRIQIFDLDGNFLGTVGSPGTGQWQFNSPDGIAVGPDSDVYISDTGNNRVEKVSIPDGAISQIDDGSLSSPEGLSVDEGGNVYVADSDNSRVAVFTPDIVVFDNGAASKTITGNQPFAVTLAINPDKYWNGAVSELYLWVEYEGIKAYWAGLPLNLVAFSSPSEMKPLASGIPIPNVPAFTWTVLNDSSVLPAGTYTLHFCLDRDVNGTFNPSSSVCGSINVVRQ